MTIFFMEWNSLCNEDMIENLEAMGHKVKRIPFDDDTLNQGQIEMLILAEPSSCDLVFSFNYYPQVSQACKKQGLIYVAWVYDSPHIQLFSYTIINECNFVFVFDFALYRELHNLGIKTVYYLPLAVNTIRMKRLDNVRLEPASCWREVAFVGSLYSERKHRLYDKFQALPEYYKGYLEGLIEAQKNVYGYNFLQELLHEDVVKEMQKVYPTNPNSDYVLSPKAIYTDYVLARQITALERTECLERLSNIAKVSLFTHDKTAQFGRIINYGPCDYYDDVPYIFRTTRINLNITLRSIKTGIPLRVLDIMGNGGFLITNYQAEMLQYFEPDEEFVYYSDVDELCDKVHYYLTHETERKKIAAAGCEKVREEFSYQKQIAKMFDILNGTK